MARTLQRVGDGVQVVLGRGMRLERPEEDLVEAPVAGHGAVTITRLSRVIICPVPGPKNRAKPPARLWVVPRNDLEAREIARLLRLAGESVAITRQPWGARWDGLEPAVGERCLRFRRRHPDAPLY